MGGIHGHHLPDDQVVELHLDGRQVLLHVGPGDLRAQLLDISGDQEWGSLAEFDGSFVAPTGKLRYCSGVGCPGIGVADIGGEEFDLTPDRGRSSENEERWNNCSFSLMMGVWDSDSLRGFHARSV